MLDEAQLEDVSDSMKSRYLIFAVGEKEYVNRLENIYSRDAAPQEMREIRKERDSLQLY
ncbi:MAG: hypothetical protein ACM3S4_02695 [Burkholderiales bacterium]|jgi:hypothetical protein